MSQPQMDGGEQTPPKDLLPRPEGVYSAGQVIRLTVPYQNSSDTLYFGNQQIAQAYLTEKFPGAIRALDTRYLALDSLAPVMAPNQYDIATLDVWTTSPPVPDSQPTAITNIVTAFVDQNPPQSLPHQIILQEQRAIGVWQDAEEAVAFYQKTQPDKTIRDSGILGGNPATWHNPIKPTEIYLQRRVTQESR